MTFGVVVGGGGPLGSAWYAGLGEGLADAGFNFAEVDVFIGTSAGAVAGAWWASGEPPSSFTESLVRRFDDSAATAVADSMPIDIDLLGEIYGLLGQATGPLDATASQRICQRALAVTPLEGDEDWNVKNCAPYLPPQWPDRFHAVVVCARDGNPRVVGPMDAIPLARGVAASAAASGLVSAVRIDLDLYFDGGARSPTNADLAGNFGLDRCLVLSALHADTPMVGQAAARVLDHEVRSLRQNRTAVAVLSPGQLEAAAFGSNLMDRSKVHEAIDAGIQRGQRDAPIVGCE